MSTTRIDALLDDMTLEEQASLLSGADFCYRRTMPARSTQA